MKKIYIDTSKIYLKNTSYFVNKEYCRHCGVELKILHAPLPCGHVICGYDCPKRNRCNRF